VEEFSGAENQILSSVCADLSENDLALLKEIYHHGNLVPVTDHDGSDYTKDTLRPLRNRGLISTEDGQSFSNSEGVKVTELGRVVIEEILDTVSS
jgi:hypothetical protein